MIKKHEKILDFLKSSCDFINSKIVDIRDSFADTENSIQLKKIMIPIYQRLLKCIIPNNTLKVEVYDEIKSVSKTEVEEEFVCNNCKLKNIKGSRASKNNSGKFLMSPIKINPRRSLAVRSRNNSIMSRTSKRNSMISISRKTVMDQDFSMQDLRKKDISFLEHEDVVKSVRDFHFSKSKRSSFQKDNLLNSKNSAKAQSSRRGSYDISSPQMSFFKTMDKKRKSVCISKKSECISKKSESDKSSVNEENDKILPKKLPDLPKLIIPNIVVNNPKENSEITENLNSKQNLSTPKVNLQKFETKSVIKSKNKTVEIANKYGIQRPERNLVDLLNPKAWPNYYDKKTPASDVRNLAKTAILNQTNKSFDLSKCRRNRQRSELCDVYNTTINWTSADKEKENTNISPLKYEKNKDFEYYIQEDQVYGKPSNSLFDQSVHKKGVFVLRTNNDAYHDHISKRRNKSPNFSYSSYNNEFLVKKKNESERFYPKNSNLQPDLTNQTQSSKRTSKAKKKRNVILSEKK